MIGLGSRLPNEFYCPASGKILDEAINLFPCGHRIHGSYRKVFNELPGPMGSKDIDCPVPLCSKRNVKVWVRDVAFQNLVKKILLPPPQQISIEKPISEKPTTSAKLTTPTLGKQTTLGKRAAKEMDNTVATPTSSSGKRTSSVNPFPFVAPNISSSSTSLYPGLQGDFDIFEVSEDLQYYCFKSKNADSAILEFSFTKNKYCTQLQVTLKDPVSFIFFLKKHTRFVSPANFLEGMILSATDVERKQVLMEIITKNNLLSEEASKQLSKILPAEFQVNNSVV